MSSDLPPFLSHNSRRGVAWRGHEAFPRKVVQIHERDEWGSFGPLRLEDLRVFRLIGKDYCLMDQADIDWYMEDPEHV